MDSRIGIELLVEDSISEFEGSRE